MTVNQFTYNDLTFGHGLDVGVVEVEGLTSLPGVRTGDSARPQADGMYPGADYLAGRILQFDLVVAQEAVARETILNAVAEAFLVRQDELPLMYELPGQDERMINCRPRKRAMKVDNTWQHGVARIAIELFASDPRLYSTTLQTAITTRAIVTGGLDTPHAFPHSFGTVSGGAVNCMNNGITDTWPIIVWEGPLTNPEATLTATGETLGVTITLAAGETLVADFKEKTVLLNNIASRTGLVVRPTSTWFALPPGNSSVRLSASAGTGTMLVTWRDAWL